MAKLNVSFNIRTIKIHNSNLLGNSTLNYTTADKILLLNSNLNYNTSVILNTGSKLSCTNSNITSPDIYLPTENLIEQENCLFTGTIHYGDF